MPPLPSQLQQVSPQTAPTPSLHYDRYIVDDPLRDDPCICKSHRALSEPSPGIFSIGAILNLETPTGSYLFMTFFTSGRTTELGMLRQIEKLETIV
jgi:hypothetical protein